YFSYISQTLITHPFPYTTLFRSHGADHGGRKNHERERTDETQDRRLAPQHRRRQAGSLVRGRTQQPQPPAPADGGLFTTLHRIRSEEHTSELQSRSDLVCRLLLE